MRRLWCSDAELPWCSFLGWRVWLQTDSFFAFCELTFLAAVLNPNGTVQTRLWEPGLLRGFRSCSEFEFKKKKKIIFEEGSGGRKILDCNKTQFPLLAFLAIFSLPWWLQVLCFWFNWGFSHPVLKQTESCAAFFPRSYNHHWASPRCFGWLLALSSHLKCNKILIYWIVLRCALEFPILQLKPWLQIGSGFDLLNL